MAACPGEHLMERGAFVLASCTYVAASGPVFLGGEFGALVASVPRAPLAAPPFFVGWVVVAAIGMLWFCQGVIAARGHYDAPDGTATLWSSGVVVLCFFALKWQWSLPSGWSAELSLASRGFFFAWMARNAVGLWLALRGLAVFRRRRDARIREPADCGDEAQLAEFREVLAGYVERDAQSARVIAEATQTVARLTAERDRFAAAKRDMETVLRLPGVRKWLYKEFHTDGHPEADDSKRRVLTESFQIITAVFATLGK